MPEPTTATFTMSPDCACNGVQDEPTRWSSYPCCRGWCVIQKPNVDVVMAGVSVNVWNAKRRFLELLFSVGFRHFMIVG